MTPEKQTKLIPEDDSTGIPVAKSAEAQIKTLTGLVEDLAERIEEIASTIDEIRDVICVQLGRSSYEDLHPYDDE